MQPQRKQASKISHEQQPDTRLRIALWLLWLNR